MPNKLKIATRQSPLALWQANYIKNRLQQLYPNLDICLVEMVTMGDKILDAPLAKIGGKGLFVKELEQALYDGRADIAVHSLKDVPMVLPTGLVLGAYCQREKASDAFVSNTYKDLDALPDGAVVGTSSLRRECQLHHYRNDLIIKTLRGNIGTRLAKLDSGEYDAIILATSGLMRMGYGERICHELPYELSLPAVGQGALAIECREHDSQILSLLKPLDDFKTKLCVIAERAMNYTLEGGCQVPIAGFAQIIDNVLSLHGRVGSIDGQVLLKAKMQVVLQEDEATNLELSNDLGVMVAKQLIEQGADKILSQIYHQHQH